MRTLDEAIQHEEEVADILLGHLTELPKLPDKEYAECKKCAEEHKQLAGWLKELKGYREGTRTCEFCKYEDKAETEYPCSICRCNHPNKFEWKDGAEMVKEATEND